MIDGDTLEVNISAVEDIGSALAFACPSLNGISEPDRAPQVAGQRVRLFGLDAPEKAQSCSDQDGNPYACGMPLTFTGVTKLSALACE